MTNALPLCQKRVHSNKTHRDVTFLGQATEIAVEIEDEALPVADEVQARTNQLDCSWLCLRANSPFRPPDWRWLRARYLHDRGQSPINGFDDSLVGAAFELLPQYYQCARQQHAGNCIAAWQAFALYAAEPPRKRWILEAWLLTGLPAAAVAAKTGLNEDVVIIYEQFFFNVLDRLQAKSYIALHVLQLHPNPAPTLGNLLKFYAYQGGPLVLDHLLALFGVQPAGKEPTTIQDKFRLGAGIVFWLLPVTASTAIPILYLHLRFLTENWTTDDKVFSEMTRSALKLLRECTPITDGDLVVPSEKRAPVSGGKTAPVDVPGGALGRWRAQRTVSAHSQFCEEEHCGPGCGVKSGARQLRVASEFQDRTYRRLGHRQMARLSSGAVATG